MPKNRNPVGLWYDSTVLQKYNARKQWEEAIVRNAWQGKKWILVQTNVNDSELVNHSYLWVNPDYIKQINLPPLYSLAELCNDFTRCGIRKDTSHVLTVPEIYLANAEKKIHGWFRYDFTFGDVKMDCLSPPESEVKTHVSVSGKRCSPDDDTLLPSFRKSLAFSEDRIFCPCYTPIKYYQKPVVTFI
jgi:hypothetical protein